MNICSISSGSGGNCVYVETDKSKILVDAGLSGKKIQDNLSKIGIKASDIDLILVTHEHMDHVQGVGVLSRRFDIPIYANEGTWLGMKNKIGKIKAKNINIFKTNKAENIRDFDLIPFATFHDARDPVGFSIIDRNQKISILTDTGKFSENILYAIKDSDAYYIEANHDEEMLRNGPYPLSLQERIRSTYGHLSNYESRDLLLEILRGNNEKVILGHLSEENNREDLAAFTIDHELLSNGLDTTRDIELVVAKRYSPSKFFDIEKVRNE